MMKLSDFSKDQIVINVYDALDTLYHDGPIEDAYPYFFDRLRYALHYLEIPNDSIKDMNYENQESYNRKQVVDLLSKVCNKYPNILNNRQFKNKHHSYVDLLGAFRLNSKHFDIKLE